MKELNLKRIKYNTLHARIMLFRDRNEYEMLMNMSPYALDNGIGWTVIDGNVPLCFLLVSPLNPNTCELHFFASYFLDKQFNHNIVKLFKDVMDELSVEYGRIQATVDASNRRNVRFAERMGLKCEGVLHHFGMDGNDYYIMAKWDY